MARKIKSMNNVFSQVMEEASRDIEASQAEQDERLRKYIEKTSKEKEKIYLDVDLFDDAPAEWNIFPPLNPDKMAQLEMSIMNSGIIDPVQAWERPNGRYMLLAGHNRCEAVRHILQNYAGIELKREYRKVPTIVYGIDEINERKAQEIIIDTNYIQRGEMTPKLRVRILQARLSIIEDQRDERGARIDEMIDNLGLKKSAVYQDIQIATKIIKPLQEYYFDGRLNKLAVLKLAMYPPDMQYWIYDKYGSALNNKSVLRLKKSTKTEAQIAEILDPSNAAVKRVSTHVMVPEPKLDMFKRLCTVYFDDPRFQEMCEKYILETYPDESIPKENRE